MNTTQIQYNTDTNHSGHRSTAFEGNRIYILSSMKFRMCSLQFPEYLHFTFRLRNSFEPIENPLHIVNVDVQRVWAVKSGILHANTRPCVGEREGERVREGESERRRGRNQERERKTVKSGALHVRVDTLMSTKLEWSSCLPTVLHSKCQQDTFGWTEKT